MVDKPSKKKKKPRAKAQRIVGKCIACGARCEIACPTDAIQMNEDGEPIILPEDCIGCRKCVKVCPAEAIEMVLPEGATADDSEGELSEEEALQDAAAQQGINAWKNVWVFIEQDQGKAHPVSWELLGVGRVLADDLGVKVCAFVLGSNVNHLAEQAFGYGADKAYIVDSPVLARYRTESYLRGAVDLIQKHKPEIVLMGATSLGRDLAGAVATHLQTGLTADCTGLTVDKQRRLLEQTRPAFGGNIMATIFSETARPQMASVRPYVMSSLPFQSGKTGEIVSESLTISEDELTTKILDVIPFVKAGTVDVASANVIVSGGRGMLGAENFALLEALAKVLGGVVGGSRSAVSSGWIGHSRQVGQTGKTVKPKLYIACGISGAIQHMVGMQDSEHIIAINKDRTAPIFEVAHLGIVGDAVEIVPAVTEILRKSKAEVVSR